MPTISLREFDFGRDLEKVRALWAASGPGVHLGRSDTPEEIYKKLARDPDLFLVAEEGEGESGMAQLVGTVLGGFDGRRGLIYHLSVAETHRCHGVGAALMDEVERRLYAKGCLRTYLLVVDGNDQAARFYAKRGWEPLDVTVFAKDMTPPQT